MIKRFFARYNKISSISFVVITVTCVMLSLSYLIQQMYLPIDEQMYYEIFDKEQVIYKSITSTTASNENDKNYHSFQTTIQIDAKDCKLIITYDNDFEIVSRKFVDTRPYTNPLSWIGLGIVGFVLGFTIWIILKIAFENVCERFKFTTKI